MSFQFWSNFIRTKYPVINQPLEREISNNNNLADTFQKPYEKQKKIGTKY